MHWNHRVIKSQIQDGDSLVDSYGIHEVFYNDKGKPRMYTAEPIVLREFSQGDLALTIARLQACLMKDVLTEADFPAAKKKGKK